MTKVLNARRVFGAALAVVVLFLGVNVPSTRAAEPSVRIDLNKLETQGQACRVYIVLENRTSQAFRTLKLDLVMFDTDGVVAKRIATEMAPLPDTKTKLKVFDVRGLGCGQIGRVLLNDVLLCEDMNGPRADCLNLIETSSRTTAPLIK